MIANTESHGTRLLDDLRDSLARIIRGKQEVIDLLLIALLSEGAVLIEGMPGVGKTTLAKALAALLHLNFHRIQCTPDLLPADITGFSVFNPGEGSFTFRPGPIFTNVLLVDEINRASPRTQSALLEAMAEHQVTIEGVQRPLALPFIVLATQNPTGARGTFPLPEAQLDRFAMQILMDYPDGGSELEMLLDSSDRPKRVTDAIAVSEADLIQLQNDVKSVHVERGLAKYMLAIVQQTRQDERVRVGCSPRATIALYRAAQASACLHGRRFALPDDVLRVAVWTLHHRLVTSRSSEQATDRQIAIMRDILRKVEMPL